MNRLNRTFRYAYALGMIMIGFVCGFVYGVALPALAGDHPVAETVSEFGTKDLIQVAGLALALLGLYVAQDRRISDSDKLREAATATIRGEIAVAVVTVKTLGERIDNRLDGRGGVLERLEDLEKPG